MARDRVESRLLDLTGAQCAWVEDAVDTPYDQWGSVPKGKLYPLVLAALDEDDPKRRKALVEEYGALSMRELQRMLVPQVGKAQNEPG